MIALGALQSSYSLSEQLVKDGFSFFGVNVFSSGAFSHNTRLFLYNEIPKTITKIFLGIFKRTFQMKILPIDFF